MKKIFIFLMTILCISIKCTNVNAESFYEAEKIDNIFTKSVDGTSAHYQKARFFRRTSDNKAAYCLEPFIFFDETKNYIAYNYATNLSADTWTKLQLIAKFGYGYKEHTDAKWYAITQLMIWKIAEPTKDFYFTSYLNGPKIDAYISEMNEINNLITDYNKIPRLNYNSTNVVGRTTILNDNNNVINNYYVYKGSDIAKIEDNKLIISNIKKGENNIILRRNVDDDNEATLFYYNSESQNLMTKGNIGEKQLQVIVNGTTNKINITKIDEDNNNTTSKGEAILTGATYNLYDTNDNLIKEITINENNNAIIENLNYGKYYLLESKPGIGYTLNKEKTYFEVNENTKTINLILKNKVIEKEITLHKKYGDIINTNDEVNISFDIYNNKNELVDTITTNEKGIAKIILPYGKYIVKQRNTNVGFNKVDDFTITIDENEHNDYYYELYDYKIEVPNTGIKESNAYILILLLILPTIFLKKKNAK